MCGEPAQQDREGKHFPLNVWTSGIAPEFEFTSKNIRVHFEKKNAFALWFYFKICEKKEN